jgi:hypothetical protein
MFKAAVAGVLQGMDYELPESAMQQLRDVAGDVSMRFRCAQQQQLCGTLNAV